MCSFTMIKASSVSERSLRGDITFSLPMPAQWVKQGLASICIVPQWDMPY